MVSEHAMLILILLLAVAVTLLAITLTVYSGKMRDRLKNIEERIGNLDAAQVRAGRAE